MWLIVENLNIRRQSFLFLHFDVLPKTSNPGKLGYIWPTEPAEISAGSRPWGKGGGGGLQKLFFRPFGPPFGLKIRGAPPLDPPLEIISINNLHKRQCIL